jgi:hypothetical protein
MDYDRVLRTYRVLLTWHDSWDALHFAFLLERMSYNLEHNDE